MMGFLDELTAAAGQKRWMDESPPPPPPPEPTTAEQLSAQVRALGLQRVRGEAGEALSRIIDALDLQLAGLGSSEVAPPEERAKRLARVRSLLAAIADLVDAAGRAAR